VLYLFSYVYLMLEESDITLTWPDARRYLLLEGTFRMRRIEKEDR